MCMNLPEMGFLADKNMGLLTNINTVDHAGLLLLLPGDTWHHYKAGL